jgi:hypothetical protein
MFFNKSKTHVQATKAYVGAKVQLHASLTQAEGGCVSASFPGSFTVGKEYQYPLNRSVGGYQRWFWRFGKEKISNPAEIRSMTPRLSIL